MRAFAVLASAVALMLGVTVAYAHDPMALSTESADNGATVQEAALTELPENEVADNETENEVADNEPAENETDENNGASDESHGNAPAWVADVRANGGPPTWVADVKANGGPPAWVATQ